MSTNSSTEMNESPWLSREAFVRGAQDRNRAADRVGSVMDDIRRRHWSEGDGEPCEALS